MTAKKTMKAQKATAMKTMKAKKATAMKTMKVMKATAMNVSPVRMKAMNTMKTMKAKKATAMKLVVYIGKDKTIMLDVEASDTIAIVTSKIKAKLPPCTFKLVTVLDDHRTLRECGFLNGSEVSLANVSLNLNQVGCDYPEYEAAVRDV